MNKDKLIERIRKLLSLAADTASPNEALIAARRARSLMDKHQISKGDIEHATGNQFLESAGEMKTSVRKEWILILQSGSAKLNDCIAVVSPAPSVKYKFRGFKSDAVVAKLTLDYFVAACEKACASSRAKGVSEKNFFRIGFSRSVATRCFQAAKERESITFSSGKSLVLCKANQIIQHFGELKKLRDRQIRQPSQNELTAYENGFIEGSKVSLDKQIEGEQVKRANLTGNNREN